VKKIIITGWSAQLKCNNCGHEHESRNYGRWEIDSSKITTCPKCKKVTNHVIIGTIAEITDYEDYLKSSSKN